MDKFIDAVLGTIKGVADRLSARIEALEKREPAPGAVGPIGPPGRQGDVGPAGADGKDADADAIRADVLASLEGKTFTREEVDAIVAVEVEKVIAQLNVADLVDTQVAKAIAQFAPPRDGKNGLDGKDGKDGQSVQVADVEPLIAAEVQKAVSAIPRAKDGVGVLGALIDREGQLVVTLSDGTTKELGRVVGRDVDMGEVLRIIAEKVAAIPVRDGKDGINGKDGADGLGFEDAEFEHDEHGRLHVRFIRGDKVKSSRVPCVVDRGVYRSTETYLKGDGTTWAGSFWIAQQDAPPGKPGVEGSGWRLAVKRGMDGKIGPSGGQGPQGPKGDKGNDGRGGW